MRQRITICLLVFLLVMMTAAGTTFANKKAQYFVDKDQLPFDALEGIETERLWGVHNGAGYRIEVPENWNGDLVLYSHGYRSEETKALTVNNPSNLRRYLLEAGYAWAASSYSKNGYEVKQGVKDTHALGQFFNGKIGQADHTYVVGHSMGGHITGVLAEQYQNAYDGAMPMCGVMGDNELFDFFTDYNLAAQALADVPVEFPAPENYQTSIVPEIKETLGLNTTLTDEGEKLRKLTMYLSGGERPLFDQAFNIWQDFLFTLYREDPSYGTPGNLINNTDSIYQLDAAPELSEEEQNLAELIPDITSDPQARSGNGLAKIPQLSGDINVPVITLHTIGDLFVPFSMEQLYAQRVEASGKEDMLVSRAIRATGHCEFTPEEETDGFTALIDWVKEGEKPEGDQILNPDIVNNRDFGITFTSPLRGYDPLSGGN
ncbi:alpha/beta fold hydrolase [Halobacillus litoralis]|uniref:alpha/beta fold hydrolase n=1 Tax=Halobacillus litoralis TaxID=45668 RepID=UPI001CFCC7A8|nr:alpha/beta hydrolase [Halobacillus litoralis]